MDERQKKNFIRDEINRLEESRLLGRNDTKKVIDSLLEEFKDAPEIDKNAISLEVNGILMELSEEEYERRKGRVMGRGSPNNKDNLHKTNVNKRDPFEKAHKHKLLMTIPRFKTTDKNNSWKNHITRVATQMNHVTGLTIHEKRELLIQTLEREEMLKALEIEMNENMEWNEMIEKIHQAIIPAGYRAHQQREILLFRPRITNLREDIMQYQRIFKDLHGRDPATEVLQYLVIQALHTRQDAVKRVLENTDPEEEWESFFHRACYETESFGNRKRTYRWPDKNKESERNKRCDICGRNNHSTEDCFFKNKKGKPGAPEPPLKRKYQDNHTPNDNQTKNL
uniref:CCHC-type domain-containing protein n=1 Tax=Strongyloides venezuelensis TaxID=75913 RepID=A0A0K0FFE8_STRVS